MASTKKPPPQPHRGRLQAQGGGVEESEKWERPAPLPEAGGQRLLVALRDKLAVREAERRAKAFEQASRAIAHAAEVGGVPQEERYPWSKSYPTPPDGDRRVDLEVHAGRAFVPNEQAQ